MLYAKFQIEKHCLVKHFAFLKNAINIKFCAASNLLFFTSYWLVDNWLSWNVLLFSCNPIGQLFLSGPGYSSRTVNEQHRRPKGKDKYV